MALYECSFKYQESWWKDRLKLDNIIMAVIVYEWVSLN